LLTVIQADTRLADNDDDEEDAAKNDADDDESPELKKAMAKKAWLEGKLDGARGSGVTALRVLVFHSWLSQMLRLTC
jgi:hypothetical protein